MITTERQRYIRILERENQKKETYRQILAGTESNLANGTFRIKDGHIVRGRKGEIPLGRNQRERKEATIATLKNLLGQK